MKNRSFPIWQNILPAAALVLHPVLLPSHAGAQEARGQSRGVLEEVIVTARKRSENIQETPVAVTAMSGFELRERGIVNARELAKSVPSLQIVEGQSNQIFLRGVGQLSGLVRQNPSVSAYLDGVFIPRADGQLLDTVDVENIQVLRGPQGTLFGKNNTGGALVFTLQKPGEEREGYIEGGLGNYSFSQAKMGYTLPISDTFSTRYTLSTQRRAGYLEDTSSSNNSSLDRWAGIAQSRWTASDQLTVDGLLYYGEVEERTPSYNCRVVSDDALLANGLGLLWAGDTNPREPRAYRENCEANSRENLPDLHTNQGSSQRQNKEINTLMLGLTFNWEFDSGQRAKVILGHRDAAKYGPRSATDDGGPADYFRGYTLGKGEQLSTTLELQFDGSALGDRIDYTVGAFAQDEFKSENFHTGNAIVGLETSSLAAIAAGIQPSNNLVLPTGTAPIVGPFLTPDRLQSFDINETTFAAFFQATWHLTDNLEFTFGGRYTKASTESELATRETDIAAFNAILGGDVRFTTLEPDSGLHLYNAGTWLDDPIAIANSLFSDPDGDSIYTPLGAPRMDTAKATFSEFTPMVSVSYVVDESLLDGSLFDSMLTYLTWSNGFKSGFLEPKGADGLIVVKPELLENLELGFKIDAFDKTVRLNLAFYTMDFDNMQLITVGVDSTNSLVVTSTNAGESEIAGGEMELSWLPTPDLLFSLSYSNNHYRFLEYSEFDLLDLILGRQTVVDRSDETFPKSPEQTFSFGAQYTWHLPLGRVTARADVSFTDDIYHGFDNGAWDVRKTNPESVMAEAYTVADLRISWENPGASLSAAVWVKNATDERYLNGWSATADSVGNFVEIVGAPRMFGVELRKAF